VPQLKVTVLAEVDGKMLPDFPYISRLTFNQIQGPTQSTKAGGDGAGVYVTVPGLGLNPALQALLVKLDNPANFILSALTNKDGVIAMQGGGVIVIVGMNEAVPGQPGQNAQINNPNAAATNLRVTGAGT
jgi:hypothetical protein